MITATMEVLEKKVLCGVGLGRNYRLYGLVPRVFRLDLLLTGLAERQGICWRRNANGCLWTRSRDPIVSLIVDIKKLIREPKPSTKFIFVYNHVDSTIRFSSFSGFRKEKKTLETPDGGSRRGFQTGISNGVPPRLMPILVPMTTLTCRANGGNYGPRR